MVYNTQSYWVFQLRPSSGILKTRKHNVSETGSVSVLRWMGETLTLLVPLERANVNHMRMETDPFSETLCFLAFRILYDTQSPKPSNSEIYIWQLNFIDFFWRYGLVAGFYERGNYRSCSREGGKFIDYLNEYQLLNKDPTPRHETLISQFKWVSSI
jgi:hypothetical protein